MRAVVMRETGGPEVLRVEEWPDPVPGQGETLIEVAAAGVNHYDLAQRAGAATTFPLILGLDAAGRRADTGERVLVTGRMGCYAELVAVQEDSLWPLPDAVDDASAAGLGVPYRVAWAALVEAGKLEQAQRLLVQAASSATGQACVDLGLALGATVFATASSSKLAKVRALGAEAFAYDDPAVAQLEANVVFDPVGAETFARSLEALAPYGVVATPGTLGDPQVSLGVRTLVGKRARVQGIVAAPAAETIPRLLELAAEGKLHPVIDRELPLEQAAEAHRAIEARETFGKVVLRP